MTTPAVVARDVAKVYRRFVHQKQFRTLKSALRIVHGCQPCVELNAAQIGNYAQCAAHERLKVDVHRAAE